MRAVWAGPLAPRPRTAKPRPKDCSGAATRRQQKKAPGLARVPFSYYVIAMSSSIPPFDDIAADFGFIDDWDEKYRYLIDLGRRLEPLADDEHSEEHRVRGCASQVWLVFDQTAGDAVRFRGDSDAAIVKGLVALMISLFSGRTKSEITALDAEAKLAEIDLQEHITPQRSNGVVSMIKRIKSEAAA